MTLVWNVWKRRNDQYGRDLVASYWSYDDAKRRMRALAAAYAEMVRASVPLVVLVGPFYTHSPERGTVCSMSCYDTTFETEATEVIGSPLSALAEQAEGRT